MWSAWVAGFFFGCALCVCCGAVCGVVQLDDAFWAAKFALVVTAVSSVVCGGVASVESSRTTMTSSKNFNNSLVHSHSITLMFAVWWAGCIVCHHHFLPQFQFGLPLQMWQDACNCRATHHTHDTNWHMHTPLLVKWDVCSPVCSQRATSPPLALRRLLPATTAVVNMVSPSVWLVCSHKTSLWPLEPWMSSAQEQGLLHLRSGGSPFFCLPSRSWCRWFRRCFWRWWVLPMR